MLNIKVLLEAIEISIELCELKELGLTDEEIGGFIETYCEEWNLGAPIVFN